MHLPLKWGGCLGSYLIELIDRRVSNYFWAYERVIIHANVISFEFFPQPVVLLIQRGFSWGFFSDIQFWPNLRQKNSSVGTGHDDLYLRRFCRSRLHDGIIYFHDKAFFTSHTHLVTKMI